MATIITREVGGTAKGSPLTNAEVDNNFINLNISKLEKVVTEEITNTATSALQVPVGTTAQRPTGADGKVRYNSDLDKYEGYNGSAWLSLGGGATGGGTNAAFYLNDKAVNTDYTIPSDQNAMSAGPITVNSGATVTVPSGSCWTIVGS